MGTISLIDSDARQSKNTSTSYSFVPVRRRLYMLTPTTEKFPRSLDLPGIPKRASDVVRQSLEPEFDSSKAQAAVFSASREM